MNIRKKGFRRGHNERRQTGKVRFVGKNAHAAQKLRNAGTIGRETASGGMSDWIQRQADKLTEIFESQGGGEGVKIGFGTYDDGQSYIEVGRCDDGQDGV